jgi:hypothetical protein
VTTDQDQVRGRPPSTGAVAAVWMRPGAAARAQRLVDQLEPELVRGVRLHGDLERPTYGATADELSAAVIAID